MKRAYTLTIEADDRDWHDGKGPDPDAVAEWLTWALDTLRRRGLKVEVTENDKG